MHAIAMCDVGDTVTSDVETTWMVPIDFVKDFTQMTSAWFSQAGTEWRIAKLLRDGVVDLHVWKKSGVSDAKHTVTVGVKKHNLGEKFSAAGDIEKTESSFQVANFCRITDLVYDREVAYDGRIRFFCRVEKIKAPQGTPEYMGARPKDMDYTKPKEVYNDHVAAGIRRKEKKELYARDTSEPSGSARNVEVSVSGVELKTPRGKLQRDLERLLYERYRCDMKIITQDGEFNAHKALVGVRSQKIASDIKEATGDTISYLHFRAAGFSVFLHFLYTASSDLLTSSNVWDVFPIADELQMFDLMQECFEYMKTCITVDNFIDMLELLLKYESQDLQRAAFKFFVKNKEQITDTSKFKAFNEKYPKKINEYFIKACSIEQ